MQKTKRQILIIAFLFGMLISRTILSSGQDTTVVTKLPEGNKIYVNASMGKNSNEEPKAVHCKH